jgi:hypothetical protein
MHHSFVFPDSQELFGEQELFQLHPFTGAKENDLKDDCVFCYTIFSIPGIQSAYIDHPLSKYVQSFSCIAFTEGRE